MTTVIHIKDAPFGWQSDPNFVYIGRPGRGLSGHYGNLHPIGFCSTCRALHDRDGAIEAFAIEARARFACDPHFREQVEWLRNKYLVCFCAPKRCHGEIFVELLERFSPVTGQ